MAMLNLLPPEAKENINFARRNRTMLRTCTSLLLVVIAMGVVVFFGSMYIDRSKRSLQTSIDTTNGIIKTEKLEDVQKDYQNLSDGVKLIVSILQKEIRFSKLLQEIGSVIPNRAVLTSIVLSDKIDNALDLQARAIDYNTATQVQINLTDPNNKLFDKVDVNSVTCNPATTANTTDETVDAIVNAAYPCTITVRALFKKDASFLFVNGPVRGGTGVVNGATIINPSGGLR
jgi:Tfp pilus assembly protein PilN